MTTVSKRIWGSDAIKKANDLLSGSGMDFKGKNYIMVNDRVRAFRAVCPGGMITTEIDHELSGNGVITIKATVTDEDGRIIATGHAQEKEENGYINKTSFVENCETSAIGRALGMCGIGIEDSIASAEELANAINNQKRDKPAELTPRQKILEFCKRKGLSVDDIAQDYGLTPDSTDAERLKAYRKMKEKYEA